MAGRRDTKERDLFYWLALCLAPGVGATTFARLLEKFQTPEAVFRAQARELAAVPRLKKTTATALTRFDWAGRVEEEMAEVRRRGYRLITMRDDTYPPLLKEIYDPPPILWTAGEFLPADRATVAMVGSRGATDWGRQTSGRLAADLAAKGVTIVSGGALGIDAAAHRGALDAGGRTIAVLGCGLDVLYPRPNRELFERMPGHGALVTEFPLGTEPKPGHFPQRNRIISGLSAGVIVVEAGEKSGALITARMALDQNREVMAVPGRAGSMKSRGANALLKQGAALVETAEDVLNEIGPPAGERARAGPAGRPLAAGPEARLTGDEKKIYETLGEGSVHVDEIGRKVGLTPPHLAPILLGMELTGLIRQLPGMRYTRN